MVTERPRPPALLASCAFGALGLLLLLVGWLAGTDTLFIVGIGAASLSLAAALWWRSQLITAWRARRR